MATFLTIPVIKGDLTITPDAGGARKLIANAVNRTFNKEYITRIASMISPESGATLSNFTYDAPGGVRNVYESTLTVAQIIALDA